MWLLSHSRKNSRPVISVSFIYLFYFIFWRRSISVAQAGVVRDLGWLLPGSNHFSSQPLVAVTGACIANFVFSKTSSCLGLSISRLCDARLSPSPGCWDYSCEHQLTYVSLLVLLLHSPHWIIIFPFIPWSLLSFLIFSYLKFFLIPITYLVNNFVKMLWQLFHLTQKPSKNFFIIVFLTNNDCTYLLNDWKYYAACIIHFLTIGSIYNIITQVSIIIPAPDETWNEASSLKSCKKTQSYFGHGYWNMGWRLPILMPNLGRGNKSATK